MTICRRVPKSRNNNFFWFGFHHGATKVNDIQLKLTEKVSNNRARSRETFCTKSPRQRQLRRKFEEGVQPTSKRFNFRTILLISAQRTVVVWNRKSSGGQRVAGSQFFETWRRSREPRFARKTNLEGLCTLSTQYPLSTTFSLCLVGKFWDFFLLSVPNYLLEGCIFLRFAST